MTRVPIILIKIILFNLIFSQNMQANTIESIMSLAGMNYSGVLEVTSLMGEPTQQVASISFNDGTYFSEIGQPVTQTFLFNARCLLLNDLELEQSSIYFTSDIINTPFQALLFDSGDDLLQQIDNNRYLLNLDDENVSQVLLERQEWALLGQVTHTNQTVSNFLLMIDSAEMIFDDDFEENSNNLDHDIASSNFQIETYDATDGACYF
ncbi:MAG: hypothetical protein ACO2ZB_06070 [Gammaproteobacteria bacterium]